MDNPKKNCKVCGKEFTPGNNKAVYCSGACKMKDRRSQKKIKALKEIVPSLKTGSEVITSTKKLEVANPGSANFEISVPPWVQKIEDYCAKEGITPEELIAIHKVATKKLTFRSKLNKVEEQNQQQNIEFINPGGLTPKQLEIRKKKMGF